MTVGDRYWVDLAGESPNGAAAVQLVRAADVRPLPVRWAWEGRIAHGELHLVVGVPGLGKTVLVGELVARASQGQLPGDLSGPVHCLVATAEDSLAHTLVPRLMAAGADLDRVHFVTVRREGLEVGLTLPDDVAELEDRVAEVEAGLVVIDPVMAHLADALDSHRDHSIRRALAPLHRLAEATGGAVVGVGHLNKAPTGDVLSRVGGSVGLTAAVRSVLLVSQDPKAPEDPGARVLVHAKSNLGPKTVSRRFRVEGRLLETDEGSLSTAGIAWAGDAPDVTDRDVLATPPSDEERSERDEAEDFLREVLSEGPIPTGEVSDQAKKAGIAERTLRRARSRLGAVARKEGFGSEGRWVLELPPDAIGGQQLSVAPLAGDGGPGSSETQGPQGIPEAPKGGQPKEGQEGMAPLASPHFLAEIEEAQANLQAAGIDFEEVPE